MRKSQQEEKRKELRQGLQDFIRQQRQAAVAPKVSMRTNRHAACRVFRFL